SSPPLCQVQLRRSVAFPCAKRDTAGHEHAQSNRQHGNGNRWRFEQVLGGAIGHRVDVVHCAVGIDVAVHVVCGAVAVAVQHAFLGIRYTVAVGIGVEVVGHTV